MRVESAVSRAWGIIRRRRDGRRRIGFVCAVVLALALSVSGCWDYLDIEQRAFPIVIGLDLTPEGRYLASLQVVLPRNLRGAGPGGGTGGTASVPGGQSPYRVVTAEGDSPATAVFHAHGLLFREIDLGQVKVIVIGESLAASGLGQLGWVSRTLSMPSDTFVTVARGQALPVVQASTPAEEIPGLFLFHDFTRKYNRSPDIIPVYAWQALIKWLYHPYMDVYMQGVTGEEFGVNHDGLAVFSLCRFSGWLTEKQTAIFGRSRRGFVQGVIDARLPETGGGFASLRIDGGSSKYWVTSDDGGIVLHVSESLRGADIENQGFTLTSIKEAHLVEGALAAKEEESIRDLLATLQQLRGDIFGFGEKLREKDPGNPALESPEAWRDAYARARVDVTVKVTILNRGFMK